MPTFRAQLREHMLMCYALVLLAKNTILKNLMCKILIVIGPKLFYKTHHFDLIHIYVELPTKKQQLQALNLLVLLLPPSSRDTLKVIHFI